MHPSITAAFLLSAAATAQTVWTVPTPDIQSVVDQASPGDVIVLAAAGGLPDYRGFTLNKGLTIRGNGATIGASASSTTLLDYQITINIPADQVAHIEDIDTSYAYAPWGTSGCRVVVLGGSVRFEDCRLFASSALSVTNADVVVSGGSIFGHPVNDSRFALRATNSRLTLRNCTITGNDSACGYPACAPLYTAVPGIIAAGCVVNAERVRVRGGSQGAVLSLGAPAVDLSSSVAYFKDCNLAGGNGVNGGNALSILGPAPELRNTTLIGGSPGGTSSNGPLITNNALTSLDLAPGWQRGAATTLTVRGLPSATFGLFLTPAVSPTATPLVVEPAWILDAMGWSSGVLDSQGFATETILVPNDPVLQHATVWFQAVSGLAFPLRASTLAGGVVR